MYNIEHCYMPQSSEIKGIMVRLIYSIQELSQSTGVLPLVDSLAKPTNTIFLMRPFY